MKNISSRFKQPVLIILTLFAAGVLASAIQQGINGFLLTALALSGVVALRQHHPLTHDTRFAQLHGLIEEVARGRFNGRIVHIGQKDALGQLCWGMNNMLDQLESCFREQKAVLDRISKQEFFRSAQPKGLHGMFNEALTGTNQSLRVIAESARQTRLREQETEAAQQEVAQLISGAARGDFSLRMPEQNKQGFFLTLARDLNTLCATTEHALQEAERVLSALANGNLRLRIEADFSGLFGQLKQHCNQTADNLSNMIGDIQQAIETVNTAASEIAQGNNDLSRRTEQQAANLEETASSLEQLSSAVKSNADHAVAAANLTERASQLATESGHVIQQVETTMSSINTSSHKISEIIGLIEGIAFQTNILALNAAVEAARAGEQGRGFAVVAAEVRTLAQRSSNAAKEITTLIGEATRHIQTGNAQAVQSGEVMRETVSAISKVNTLVADMSAAIAEQSLGLEEINQAVAHMDDATQQNAALVEEAAAAAESLQAQSDQLSDSMSAFQR